jgi:hypothetical protein
MDIPAEYQTLNERIWYLRNFIGLSFREIGEELGFEKSGVMKRLQSPFKRQSVANIYHKQQAFCRKCTSVEDCKRCKLYQFMITMLDKAV